MRRVYQEYDIGLANLPVQVCAVLGRRRGIDNGGCDNFRSADARGYRNLRENWLDLCGDEDILDERRNETRFTGAFVAAYADSNWGLLADWAEKWDMLYLKPSYRIIIQIFIQASQRRLLFFFKSISCPVKAVKAVKMNIGDHDRRLTHGMGKTSRLFDACCRVSQGCDPRIHPGLRNGSCSSLDTT